MKMKGVLILLVCVFFTGNMFSQHKDPMMDKFIDGLMSKMTLEEKIGQLNLPASGDITTGQAKSSDIAEKIKKGQVGGLFNIKGVEKIKDVQRIAVEESRLKIPLIFGMDVIHGYETVFPIPLGLAATWDMAAVEQSARVAAIEASADGICWTFSPMVDISRDPRWGRIAESGGEDPFLGGQIAKAMVRGYQGVGDKMYAENSNIMACVKHYALYGAGEAGRDYNTVDMSRIRMFNEYLYPYQAAVEAGVGSVMASFNEVDGVPATANKWLMTDVLRKQWGFNGFVVTDYTGISEMINHGIGDLQTVSARALNAGIDMDMVSEGLQTLNKSLNEGKVTQAQIDQACRRILEAKYKLGLFSDPYKYCDLNRSKTEIYTSEHRAVARKIASESFVLLKNANNTLPLKKEGTIAVVGPLANTRSNMSGTWSVAVDLAKPATVVEGIQAVAGNKAKVVYAKGSHLMADAEYEDRATMFDRSLHRDQETRSHEELLQEALQVAKNADVIVAALGESSEMNGESSSRSELSIPDVQQALLKELLKTGKPVVLVLFTGRPLTLAWENEHVPAILNVWFGGTEAAYAIGDVLFGDVNPSGKLAATFPQHVGQIPLYYNHKNTGRPLEEGKWFTKFLSNYLDVSNDPLYPFGYGLSYTTFNYSDVELSATNLDSNGELTASVTVTNTGKQGGAEVVQLYIRDIVGSVTRPVKELKGFEKVFIEAGESKTVRFKITPDLLKFYNYDLEYVFEPGDFDVMIGGNSHDVKSARFTLNTSKYNNNFY
jgi:beta-glucosidase